RTAAASAERRAALTGEKCPTARVSDLPAAVPVLRGKVEFAPGEEGQEVEVLGHLLRRATAEVFRDRLPESALEPLTGVFAAGGEAVSGEGVPAGELLGSLGPVPDPASLAALADAGREPLAGEGAPAEGADRAEGLAAAAADLALEGLYLTRRLSKETAGPARDRSTCGTGPGAKRRRGREERGRPRRQALACSLSACPRDRRVRGRPRTAATGERGAATRAEQIRRAPSTSTASRPDASLERGVS